MEAGEALENGSTEGDNPYRKNVKLSLRVSIDYLSMAYKKENVKAYDLALNHCYSSIISAINAVMYIDGIEASDFETARSHIKTNRPEFDKYVEMVDQYMKMRPCALTILNSEDRGPEEFDNTRRSAIELIRRVSELAKQPQMRGFEG
jgi:HEPN domain-containing protein